jgi:membrane-associated phospholipid phosphatase
MKAHLGSTRRGFFGTLGAASMAALPGLAAPSNVLARDLVGPLPPCARKEVSFLRRVQAALQNKLAPVPPHPCNGDEARYPDKIGSYSKGLPHDAFGEVDLAAYEAMKHALVTGKFSAFEAIPMGCPDPLRLVNPLAGLAFDLEGRDSHQLYQPPAPALASAEEAGEMVEHYWQALLRDVPFESYGSDPLAAAAAADLSSLSDFRGPRVGGAVTPQVLFRDDLPGSLVGPYISQFFWMPSPLGANFVEQRIRTKLPGSDCLTDYAEWLSVQNGCKPGPAKVFDPVRRYIRAGRDLAEWLRVDVLFQAYFDAALIMLSPPNLLDVEQGGLGIPFNPGNPYLHSATQTGFATFGPPYVATLIAEVATRALKAVWFQKWYVHRRLRPENYAGLVHHVIQNGRPYPVHPDVLNSEAVSRVYSAHGAYLLPMAYQEGAPLHPSYGSGHGTVAGACVTVLKALFDGSHVIDKPVVAAPDGLSLLPYSGPPLTITGELNKLASNVATGRNIAGVHWRSDAWESLKLGEQVGMSILRDMRLTYPEPFGGFTFQKFDGTTVTV